MRSLINYLRMFWLDLMLGLLLLSYAGYAHILMQEASAPMSFNAAWPIELRSSAQDFVLSSMSSSLESSPLPKDEPTAHVPLTAQQIQAQSASALASLHSIHADPKAQHFIHFMYPKVLKIEQPILVQRSRVQADYGVFLSGKPVSSAEKVWLTSLAQQYGLKSLTFTKRSDWTNLLSRVDIVPPSLVLAQAADESGWGHSRFAREENDYFGQECHSHECGLVQQGDSRVRFQRFSSVEESIQGYVHNLNTHSAYTELRALRASARAQGKPVTGSQLVVGLRRYSSLGRYVQVIRGVMTRESLVKLDKTFPGQKIKVPHA